MAVSRLTTDSKLHIHGVLVAKEDDKKWKDQASSLADTAAAAEDNDKSQKPHKSTPKPKKLIHLISILTVPCFLVFYLSSHGPSQTDLVQFGGFHRLSIAIIDSTGTDDFGRFLDMMFWRFGA